MIKYVSNEPEGKIDSSLFTFADMQQRYSNNKNKKDKDIKGIKIEYNGQPLVIAPLHKLFSFGVKKNLFDEKKHSLQVVIKEEGPIFDAIMEIEKACDNYVRNLRSRPRLESPLKNGRAPQQKLLNAKVDYASRFFNAEKEPVDYKNYTFPIDVWPSFRIDSMFIIDEKAYLQFKIDEAVVIPRQKQTKELALDLSRLDLNS